MSLQASGMTLYGWTHLDDGTSYCRRWFMLLGLPLIPLGRYRVRSRNIRPRGFRSWVMATVGMGDGRWHARENITYIERIGGWTDIFWTLLSVYGVLAALVDGVYGFLVGLGWLHDHHVIGDAQLMYVVPVMAAMIFGLPIGFVMFAERYALGIRVQGTVPRED
jgi:hypothetical protein